MYLDFNVVYLPICLSAVSKLQFDSHNLVYSILKEVNVHKLILKIGMLLFLSACASNEYYYGTGQDADKIEQEKRNSPVMEEQFILGAPHKLLDFSDWIWPGSWLGKLFLWNRNLDSHEISDQTVAALRKYLHDNELDNVQVLVNAYKPGNQWRRLFKNRTVGAGWRYTLGVLSVAYYTVLPGRFFGGDAYNPYTNTIYLYSDSAAIAMHEGGHAKDTGKRRNKGLHAALYNIPGAPLYYEARATNDTLSYLYQENLTAEQKKAYKILHPAYGTYVFGAAGTLLGRPALLPLFGALPGHVSGRIAASVTADSELKDEEKLK